VEKCVRVQQAIDNDIMLHGKEAVCIPIALPWQQWLCEHTFALRYTSVACLISYETRKVKYI